MTVRTQHGALRRFGLKSLDTPAVPNSLPDVGFLRRRVIVMEIKACRVVLAASGATYLPLPQPLCVSPSKGSPADGYGGLVALAMLSVPDDVVVALACSADLEPNAAGLVPPSELLVRLTFATPDTSLHGYKLYIICR